MAKPAKRECPQVAVCGSPEAAALAMPPLTDEAIAVIARVLADVDKRRGQENTKSTRQSTAA